MTDLMQSSEWLDSIFDELLDWYGMPKEYIKRPAQEQAYREAKQAILQKFEEAQLTAYNKGWSDCNRQFVKVGLDSTHPQTKRENE